MRQTTFFLTSVGWRTFSVGQIHMSKAQKHIESAHKSPLRPSEDLCGHETYKHFLRPKHEAENFFPDKFWLENFFCGTNSHAQGTETH